MYFKQHQMQQSTAWAGHHRWRHFANAPLPKTLFHRKNPCCMY